MSLARCSPDRPQSPSHARRAPRRVVAPSSRYRGPKGATPRAHRRRDHPTRGSYSCVSQTPCPRPRNRPRAHRPNSMHRPRRTPNLPDLARRRAPCRRTRSSPRPLGLRASRRASGEWLPRRGARRGAPDRNRASRACAAPRWSARAPRSACAAPRMRPWLTGARMEAAAARSSSPRAAGAPPRGAALSAAALVPWWPSQAHAGRLLRGERPARPARE